MTSPRRVTADSSSWVSPASSRRIRCAARRSTKRLVSRSCSASDSRSSTSRARALPVRAVLHPVGRARRCRTTRARPRAAASACRYRRPRGPARRSAPPASRSADARRVAMWPNTRAQSRVCVSSASLRKSGIWQASHSRRDHAAVLARGGGSPARAPARRASPGPRRRCPSPGPGPGGGAIRVASSASTWLRSRSLLRQQS